MDDDTFGPALHGAFDFTLRFELLFFFIIPSIFLLISLPFYIYSFFRSTSCVRAGILLWAKLSVALSLVAVQAAALACFHEPYAKHGMDLSIPAAATSLTFISAIVIAFLVYVGHVYHYSSPAFLGLFLTISVLLDIAAARSLSLRQAFDPVSALQIAVPVIKVIILILEEISKRSLLLDQQLRSSLSCEATAGFWSRSFFFWINGLLLTGFQHDITRDDIGDIRFDTEALYQEFASHWDQANKQSRFAVLLSCIRAMPEFFIFVILPRLLSIGFNFSQPFLLQKVVNTVSEVNPDPRVAASLIGATALIYTGKSMCTTWYTSYRIKLRVGVRGMLLAALYNKSLRLSTDELSKVAVLTLMSTDVNGIQGLISLSYESWARVIEVGLGLGILAVFIGPSCIFTLIPAIISSILSTFATKKMSGTRKRWNERIESRVAETSMMLSQIKDLKMTGLAPVMAKRLQEQMDSEIKVSMGDRHARSLTWSICALVETGTPALVIGATLFWTRASEGLSVADFYTTLALTSMVTGPFASILLGLPHWATAWASVVRVQEYLCKEEREDCRIFEVDSLILEEKSLSSGSSETSQITHSKISDPDCAIQFLDVSVFSLCNTSFNIRKGSKAMLCGAVGAGKSTIMKAILGELKLQSGQIFLFSKSVAYCEQDPWILNATIEENIIGGSARDSERLWKVVHICALDADLDRLPNGILTLAGSEGCNLSGGQKQRIALARSLYVSADILLLDDVFSALDVPTASTIRQRMFGNGGYFSQYPTTLVMATNIAQHLEDADLVLEVGNSGQVKKMQHTYMQSSLHDAIASEPISKECDSSDSELDEKRETATKSVAAADEPTQQRYGDWSLYGYFFGAAGVRNIILWVASIILAALVERFPPIYVRIWQDAQPHNNLYYIGYAIISFANPLCNMLCSLAYFYLVNSAASKSLHRTLADTTSSATLDFLTKEDTGVLLNRFSQDISVATQELPLYVMPTAWLFFTIFIDIGVIASGATYASPILPLFLLLVYGVQYFYLRTSRQLRFLELDASKSLYKQFKESSKGISHIRAFQWQSGFAKQLYNAANETQKPVYALACIQQWLSVVLSTATTVAAICVVTLALKFTSQTSSTAIGLALLSLIEFSELLSVWIAMWTGTETSIGAVSRTRQFAQSTPAEEDSTDAEKIALNIPTEWPQSGRIEIRNLSACYQANGATPRAAFESVSVSISPGQKVGIVGRTGSGKTSLLLTMLHLLEHSGSVIIDGIDLRRVPRNMLRSRVTTITQSGILLPGSVRFNINPFFASIRPGQVEITDDVIIEVLRRIGSGLWQSIESRGGLDADMSKIQLSQGQRQLVQLARAVVHKQNVGTNIVLVDEGSASLDQDTELRVQKLMNSEFRDCTVITVSHRPAAMHHVDFFIRMTDGRAEIVPALGPMVENGASA